MRSVVGRIAKLQKWTTGYNRYRYRLRRVLLIVAFPVDATEVSGLSRARIFV